MLAARAIILGALATLVTAAPASAQRDTAVRQLSPTLARFIRDTPSARGNPRLVGLTVRLGDARWRLDLNGRVGAWRIDSVFTLAAAKRADTLYLLADVSGRSRGNSGGGHCGAGTEGDLLWVKLAPRRVLALRTAPYASCWRNIGTAGEQPAYSMSPDSLWMDEEFPRSHQEVRIRYYLRDPMRGLEALVDTASADSLPRYPLALLRAGKGGEIVVRHPVARYISLADSDVSVLGESDTTLAGIVRSTVAGWNVGGYGVDTARTFRTIRFTFAIRDDGRCREWRAGRSSVALPPPRRASWLPAKDGELQARIESCGGEPDRVR